MVNPRSSSRRDLPKLLAMFKNFSIQFNLINLLDHNGSQKEWQTSKAYCHIDKSNIKRNNSVEM
jgi:hypothetical protein